MGKEAINSVIKDKGRMLKYKMLSSAFSYPGDDFFKYFPELRKSQSQVVAEYDWLFRRQGIWLYTTEYTSQGNFQQARHLSDIMGFYKAFGLKLGQDRPDSLSVEFEFMHYLIFKQVFAWEKKLKDFQEKAGLCFDAQIKFFTEYVYQGAKMIAESIIREKKESNYGGIAQDLLIFLGEEKEFFQINRKNAVVRIKLL